MVKDGEKLRLCSVFMSRKHTLTVGNDWYSYKCELKPYDCDRAHINAVTFCLKASAGTQW